jgi:hypothetical protein
MWARLTVCDTAIPATTVSAKTTAAILKYFVFIDAPAGLRRYSMIRSALRTRSGKESVNPSKVL